MAKVQVENLREHDITVHATNDDGVVGQVTVPAAKQNPDDRSELVPGVAEMDSAMLAAARRDSPVVRHYFEEGWLRQVAKTTAKTKTTDDDKE